VLIVGEPGTSKTLLFRAIAGLWPWGSGRIVLPSSDGVMFVPREPYTPLGTVREALAYPSSELAFKDDELVAVLELVGLNRLSDSLDRAVRWEQERNDDEQQLLVIARIALHQPRFVVIDGVLDAFGSAGRDRIIKIFNAQLKDAAIVHIGRPCGSDLHFFTRILHLIKYPDGRCFIPNPSVTFADRSMAAPEVRPVNPVG